MTQPVSSHATSTDLLVLHTLRCIGFSGLSGVARASGLLESDIESELIDLAVDGLVTHAAGDFGGWGLTEEGRAADAGRIADELEEAGTRARLTAAFDRFLVLNPELLDICTAWQTRTVDGSMTMNDHSDPPTTPGCSTGSRSSTSVPSPSAPSCPRRCSASSATPSGSPTHSPGRGPALWST